jgi:hypothetical protein
MSGAVQMDAMVTETRRLADQETLDQASALATDAEIESRLNRNLKRVWLALVRARGAGFCRKDPPHDFVTSPGVESYPLPVDFLSLASVSLEAGNGEWIPLLDFGETERHDFARRAFGGRLDNALRYQLHTSSIVFAPVPTFARTVRLAYAPTYTPISGTQTFDGVAGFEEWAIWETVAELQAKDGENPALAMQKAKWWEGEVESMARERDGQMPQRVARTRRLRRRGWWP